MKQRLLKKIYFCSCIAQYFKTKKRQENYEEKNILKHIKKSIMFFSLFYDYVTSFFVLPILKHFLKKEKS